MIIKIDINIYFFGIQQKLRSHKETNQQQREHTTHKKRQTEVEINKLKSTLRKSFVSSASCSQLGTQLDTLFLPSLSLSLSLPPHRKMVRSSTVILLVVLASILCTSHANWYGKRGKSGWGEEEGGLMALQHVCVTHSDVCVRVCQNEIDI